MKPYRVELIVITVFGAGVAGFYYWYQSTLAEAPPVAAPTQAEAPAQKEPFPKYPLGPEATPAPEKPLPALNESDPEMRSALGTLLGLDAFGKFIRPEEIVRHVVVTIDNLPRKHLAERLSPVHPPASPLRVTGKDGDFTMAPANAARYTPYVALAESVDSARIVALYVRFYPLFQQAYVDLGYPNGYFNDRLVETIDHLLATPVVQGPVKLVVPHVLYEFADPALEERSAGQKILIRMGTENSERVKAKLRDLKRELLEKAK